MLRRLTRLLSSWTAKAGIRMQPAHRAQRPIPTFVPLAHKADGQKIWTAVEFEHGRKGAYGFSTRERCAEFIQRLQLDLDQQRVTSLDRENLIGWLESCLEVGVEVLIIDDDPEEPAVWAAEIRDVLQALRWVRDEDFGQERAEVVCEQWDCAD
jgi:hypothetical protein